MALVILPAGLSPLGLGVPVVPAPLPPPPVLPAERMNAKSKDLGSVVYGDDPIDQQVQLAFTVLGASGAAVMRDGQRFLDVRKLDSNAPTLLENEARRVLARLVGNGDISIEKVRVAQDSSGQWAEVYVDYINRRRPKSKTRTVRAQLRAEATNS